MRLLLLEDNLSDAVLAEEYLNEDRKRRYDIARCTTLEEALMQARAHPYHAALLDLFVPDSRGLDTLRAFKAEFPDAAILILTGLDDEDLAVEAVGLGAQDYVLKSSLGSDVLARTVRHAIARKNLERRLSASEQSYRDLFTHSLDGVAQTAPDGSIAEMNEAFAEMLGYTLEEARTKKFHRRDVVDPQDPRVLAALHERSRTGRFRGEMNFVRKDGTVFPVELTTNIFLGEDGLERTSMIVRDVSEQRANEQRLRDYQEQLERSERMSLVMIAHTDLEGRWLTVPPRFCDLLGYGEEELLTLRYQDVTHPDDLTRSVAIDEQILAGADASLEIEKRYIRKDGRTVWVYLNSTIVTDHDGRPLYLRKFLRDITAERAAEEHAIRSYELLLRRITSLAEEVSLAPEPAAVFRALFAFARASTPADTIFVSDYDRHANLLTPVFSAGIANGAYEEHERSALPHAPPEHSPHGRAIRERSIAIADGPIAEAGPAGSPGPRHDEPERAVGRAVVMPMVIEHEVIGLFELRNSGGTPFADEHVTALRMAADLAAIATRNLQLLTEERAMRKQVEAERERLESIFQHAPAQMAVYAGPAHVVSQANPTFLEFFAAKDVVGRPLRDVMPELESQGILDRIAHVYETGESYVDPELVVDLDRSGDGRRERHYFNLVFQALRDGNGAITGVLANAVPITEQVLGRMAAERMHAEIESAYQQTIMGWARALDLRDEETAGHSQRVTDTTVALARHFGMAGAELEDVRRGALLHDIGKMGIPDEILLKPGTLAPDEWAVMKRHTVIGRDLLQPIAFLQSAIDIPYCHHEKWDGSGYPRGLEGTDIPLAARIFAVVDVFDALMSDRPYRRAWPRDRVLEHLRRGAGSHFDPSVVNAFFDLMVNRCR